MARAITYISSSVPTPLMALQPHKMKRQLSCVYPLVGSILSTLGEKGNGPRLPFKPNGNPVISHLPVQRLAAHSSVRSKGNFLRMASERLDVSR